MTSALPLIPTLNPIDANRGRSRAGDELLSGSAHRSRTSSAQKGTTAMNDQPTISADPETEQGRHPIRKIEVFGVVDGDGKLFESHHVVGCDGRAEDEQDYAGVFLDRQAAHLLAGECGSDDNPLDVQPMILSVGQDTQAKPPTVETECFVLIGQDGKPEIWPEAHTGGNFEGVISAFSVMPDMRNAAFMLTRRSEHEEFNIRKARLIIDSGSPISESDDSATPRQRLIDLFNSPPVSGESFEQFKASAYSLLREALGPQKPVPEPIDVWVGFNDGKVMTANHDEDDSSKCLLADVYTDHRHGMMEIMGTGSVEGAAEMVAATLVFKESPRIPRKPAPDDNFMQTLMDPKTWDLMNKLDKKPEHVLEAFAMTNSEGQPLDCLTGQDGQAILGGCKNQSEARTLADSPGYECEYRRVVMAIMPKVSEVSTNGGES